MNFSKNVYNSTNSKSYYRFKQEILVNTLNQFLSARKTAHHLLTLQLETFAIKTISSLSLNKGKRLSKDAQLRFYDVSEHFGDDERVMAHAIKEFLCVKDTAEEIYTDLLDCQFEKWVLILEDIKKTVPDYIFIPWKSSLKFKDGIWLKGDEVVLTERAWKLKTRDGVKK